ncbi:MAG: EAL domain-containing protein [Betaproteobacteria bacterium]|nr:EAL domain-containing protein [Betaproteobacteria bacterium]
MSWLARGGPFAYFASGGSALKPAPDAPARRGKMRWVFRRIAPYAGAIGALLLVAMVLFTMYFTLLEWQWFTFFSGVLGAAVLSLASRSIHAEWMIARRNAQLSQARQNLANEARLRTRAEQDLAGVADNITYLHESLPAMLAYVDDQHQLKYHNRAFRHGLGAAVSHIDGRHLREVVGNVVYGELEGDLSRAFDGSMAHRERLHKSTAGETFRLLMQCLPQFNETGQVVGVFLLSTDITGPQDFALPPFPMPTIEMPVVLSPAPLSDRIVELAPEHDDDAVLLQHALAHDEFCLFFQAIVPVTTGRSALPFREILLRLKVEEENMLPPGSFLPVAEKYGMLPDLDRWVVRHVLGWIRADATRQQAMYSINISPQTLADHEFPAFVKKALRDFGLPGSLLCFELQENDILSRSADASRFVAQLQPEGCSCAICGFNGNRISFDLLRQVPVNFLKIDGSLILNVLRSAVDLARVKAIHRVAQAIGVSTIAECVEDERTLEVLRGIGVDFAQGFGISRPQDLRTISTGQPAIRAGEYAARHINDTMAAE